ncbi:MAG: hypothetical protein JW939_04150 [Candidatus Thermoplasmatota archaeon]|nr:hypothetical protein [Candidatus Thermoplasmatota archaeon]
MHMEIDEKMTDEMRAQLTFLFGIKESMKDIDDRIRATSLFLARTELIDRHRNIKEWTVMDRPDESTITGSIDGVEKVIAKVRTMSLHGKSSFGGRQHEAMKRNLERIAEEKVSMRYFFLLDPWTVNVAKETFKPEGVTVLPLLKEDMTSVVRAVMRTSDETGMPAPDTLTQMVEEVITREEYPEERTIVSPISRTSIRQGFLYIPKEKGHLLEEGPVTIWIRKDASLVTKCMISLTGGVRLGGGLTKWFRSIGLQAGDELIMGSNDDGSLLVLMIRRAQPYRGQTPVIETMKWE